MKVEVVVNLAACSWLRVQCADFGYENPVEGNSGGTYNMFLRPADDQTWDDGLYAGSLSAGDADGDGTALVSFSID